MVLNRVKNGLKLDFRLSMITGRRGEIFKGDFFFLENGSEIIFFICILTLDVIK